MTEEVDRCAKINEALAQRWEELAADETTPKGAREPLLAGAEGLRACAKLMREGAKVP